MSNRSDFVITKAGKLKKYSGSEKNVVIPDGVVEIGERAFWDTGIETVQMPSSLRIIGQDAFSLCSQLRTIIVPESVEKIEPFAFPRSVEYIRIPDALIRDSNLSRIGVMFGGSSELDNLVFALLRNTDNLDGLLKKKISAKILRKFEEYAKSFIRQNNIAYLQNLLSLKKTITIEQIDELISYAAGYADSLSFLLNYKNEKFTQEIVEKHADETILKELGIMERSVADWRKIFKFSVKDGQAIIKGYKGTDENLRIPDQIGHNEVTAIGGDAFGFAFSGCDMVKHIFLPRGLKTIGPRAFEMCSKRETLVVSEENTTYSSAGNCLIDISTKTIIMGCNGSSIPDDGSVLSIGSCAFEWCGNITEINIPDTITSIERNAFCNCRNLKQVYLSKNIATIEKNTFLCCMKLEKIILPESVTSIGQNAFAFCTNLLEVTIPGSVTSIDSSAFFECPNVKIKAPAGSYAETYAKENNIPFGAE